MTRASIIIGLGSLIILMGLHPANAQNAAVKNDSFQATSTPISVSTKPNQSVWVKPENRLDRNMSPEKMLAHAKILVLSRRLEAALLILERAIGIDNSDYHVWNMLGEIHQRLGHSAKAMKAFNKAHALDPDLATTCEYG